LYYSKEKAYNPGVYSIPFNPSNKGMGFLYLVGHGWSVSEKLILN
jgi:hypothetical protein